MSSDKLEKLNIDLINSKIDQFNNIITQFSKYSFTIKQLLITTLGICLTFFTASFKKNTFKNLPIVFFIVIIITLLFYIIDCFTYYYQDTMQQNLFKEEEKLYLLINKEYSYDFLKTCISKESRFSGVSNRIFRCLFAPSNLIYLVVAILFFTPVITIICIYPDYFTSDKIFINLIFIFFSIVTVLLVSACCILRYKIKKQETKKIVFISYTTKDPIITKELLLAIKIRLWKEYKINSFIDLLDNKSKDIQKEIKNQIKKCSYLFVIDSEKIHESEWVEYEISYASEQNKKIIYYSHLEMLYTPLEVFKKKKPKLNK